MAQYTDNVVVLNAVTTTTTSSTFDISKREQVSFQFTSAGISSGNGVFSVQISNDGTNWIPNVAMQDPQSTSSTTLITSRTHSANTTNGMFFPLSAYRYCRVICTVTTDGNYTATMESQGS